MKFEVNSDINEHFLRFDKNVRDLKAISATMENLDIICHLLLTLPKAFDNLVTALETIDPSNLSHEFVKSRILDESSKRIAVRDGSSKSNDSVAMQTKSSKIICFKCGKPGHVRAKCYARFGRVNEKSNPFNKHNNAGSANSASKNDEDFDDFMLCASDEQSMISAEKSEVRFGKHDDITQLKFFWTLVQLSTW